MSDKQIPPLIQLHYDEMTTTRGRILEARKQVSTTLFSLNGGATVALLALIQSGYLDRDVITLWFVKAGAFICGLGVIFAAVSQLLNYQYLGQIAALELSKEHDFDEGVMVDGPPSEGIRKKAISFLGRCEAFIVASCVAFTLTLFGLTLVTIWP
ncbi:hypothetical protein OCH239_04320 [Roseivivax halodurans JCM 10272]|uniref:Uncharacterized protein n=1 Tax=Roseivivax halodurans JCM 10272 TaxID=1449350 RepID=X7EGH0_9RHOB|nr:hypothetical protein [Roseivivax halodurans]ETX14316.1 hypothetical protein OCH239_04320 [Roseivivax halodurans JCM 10272]